MGLRAFIFKGEHFPLSCKDITFTSGSSMLMSLRNGKSVQN